MHTFPFRYLHKYQYHYQNTHITFYSSLPVRPPIHTCALSPPHMNIPDTLIFHISKSIEQNKWKTPKSVHTYRQTQNSIMA